MLTFNWFPDIEAQESCKPNVQVTKFGDGYETRVPVGVNSTPSKWALSFKRGTVESLAIREFLRSHGGSLAFIWINPFEEQGTYVCREWKLRRNRGVTEVTCDFEQVFEY